MKAYIDDLRQSGVVDLPAYFDAHPDAVRECATLVSIVDVNQATLRMYAAGSKADLWGGLDQFFSQESLDVFKEELLALAEGRASVEAEIINRALDGAARLVALKLSVAPGSEQTWSRMFVSLLDITERKQRERELESLVTIATALRAAHARADMMPVILNQLMSLLRADGAALVTINPSSGDAVFALARGVWESATGLRLASGEGVTGQVIATGRPYVSDELSSDPRFERSDLLGDVRAGACVPLVTEGEIMGALWIVRRVVGKPEPRPVITGHDVRLLTAIGDIAANALHRAKVTETLEQRVEERTRELAEANARLTELDRLKTKFVSDVSHELRTPVTNLSLYLNLLERGRVEKRDQYIVVLKDQAARLAQLIEDILDLSRLERDKNEVRFSPVDLKRLVEQVVAAHQPRAEAMGLSLSLDLDADLPHVRGESNQLGQVVTNLVTNAINYTRAGQVHVALRAQDGRVCLVVRDTGVGIHAEDLPHVFERFYRGKHAAQSEIPGTGLGLGIVKEIIDLHAGTIEVESQLGQGSTFRVWLPLA